MYRHGLRVSKADSLRWEQVDLKAGMLHVNRLKNGVPSTHPLRGPELRLLRQLRRNYPEGPYGFASGRVRHACGYKLANDGHDTRGLQHYLGHRNIQRTVRYTEMASDRFKSFWRC